MSRTCYITFPYYTRWRNWYFTTEFWLITSKQVNVNRPCSYCIYNMLNFVSSFKGLVVDLEDGNLVKLAEDGTVLRYALAARNLFDLLFPKNISSVPLSKLSLFSQTFGIIKKDLCLAWLERHMEAMTSAQKRSSNIMVQKGSGSTSTASIPPSQDLV